ncbi:DUF4011 domain-containing protein [Nocardia cyriacigeorgica]|uniref:AAA domain-containing protein n=1 Tax=Nocardia cyriacigeorgica TaxID=135487 RepID=UPI0018936613|nr:AAA domain-containing protein [Nocardia cyriacigeorgica]MBF6088913.1 DUF4011 domain-containing protein [Nocardia cyriacigeorgica]MBF6398507.1 DUF4011 domain-containing protein [Nocardia cyriacigeorgica]MBF6403979.1 DUF4011 domain-containing protein [Nocardia cyriacigeorgica]
MSNSGHDRETRLERKANEWAKELIQLDARNGLLNFTVTKTSSLDLASSPDSALRQLFSGQQVRLGELFTPGDAYRDACTRTRTLARRIRGFSEEQGVDVGRLVFGRVTSEPVKRGGARAPVPLKAPLLLFQVTIQARTATENDFAIRIDPEPELNPVLAHALQREYGVDIDTDELADVLPRAHESAESMAELADKTFQRLATVARDHGVQLDLHPMVAVGVCNYTKLPMVDDLMSATQLMGQHDLVAMLAGCDPVGADPRTEEPYVPGPVDMVPPNRDHLVLDADVSQYRAVTTALGGRNLVIDGPPGTGKSQTIANIIAAGCAQGLKILFVAEKRAAIEAVTSRLTEVGLDGLVLDLHQSAISNRAVAAQLGESFERLRLVGDPGGDELDRELNESRKQLNDYTDALHATQRPWELSPYQVRERLLGTAGAVETTIRLRQLKCFNPEVRLQVENDLRQFVANGGLRLIRHESPWWCARIATAEDARAVLMELDSVTGQTLHASQSSMRSLVAQARLPEPTDLPAWESTLTLLNLISECAQTMGPGIFQGPLDEYLVATASWSERRDLTPKLGWRRRSALVKALRANPAGITRKQELNAEISKVRSTMELWRRMRGAEAGPGAIGDIQGMGGQYQRLKTQLAAIAMSAGVELEQKPLDQISSELHKLASERDLVPFLPDLNQQAQRLRGIGLDPLLNEIATRDMNADQAVATFRHAFLRSLDEEYMLTCKPLRDFQPERHDHALAKFQDADRRHLSLAAHRVLRSIARSAQAAGRDHPGESTLLRSEAKRKRGHKPLRRLVAEAPNVLLAVRPCWAMSPLVVSRALPAQQLFDLVIFDEASQVQPHDAITSIIRGRRLIVAGDEKQLPPTSFFERLADDSADSEGDDVELNDYESILTTLQPLIANRCRLEWHYRSQDERLIHFSNEEVYGGDLVSFPGARVDTPIRLEIVDGRVRPGASGSSDAEVARVVELIIEHAECRPKESLGVITLGTPHQKRLDMALREAREHRRDLDEFFSEERGPTKRFFIKSIETVQGDERDAIILSVGVAKGASGKVSRTGFGILNREGTERRINVAVTRAKRRMTVVSSFPPGALDPSERMTGTELLRRYLDAAHRGGETIAVGRQTGTELNGFEREIYDALTGRGVPVAPQWGVSNYRIDLALAHPDEPGRMVLAVEADGDSYHRMASARDRDRLRQQHLERLGWRFHRVWASAWYANPQRELDRILQAWKEAIALSDDETATKIEEPQHTIQLDDSAALPTKPRPDVQPGLPITGYSHAQVVSLFMWRMSDGLLLDPAERMAQVRADLGFRKRGRRIDERLQKAHDDAQRLLDSEEK